MELDLQSLFGLRVHSCTHWLRPSTPPPALGLYTRALLVSQDRRHIFVTPCLHVLQELYDFFSEEESIQFIWPYLESYCFFALHVFFLPFSVFVQLADMCPQFLNCRQSCLSYFNFVFFRKCASEAMQPFVDPARLFNSSARHNVRSKTYAREKQQLISCQ